MNKHITEGHNESVEVVECFIYHGYAVPLHYLSEVEKYDYRDLKQYAEESGYSNVEGQQLVELWLHYGRYDR